jgi:N-acetylglucosaminyldiphosphoundecaprenol N-acetyl-beta-D-mannosaminyltransferase
VTALSQRPPAVICGVPIANATMQEAIDSIGDLTERGRALHRGHQVATVNVDFLVKAATKPDILCLLQEADLCLADGTPVVWAGRALGMPIVERVAGADLVPALAERASTTGWRIHLYGSAPGTAERAAELLRQRHPGADVTGESGGIVGDVANVDDEVIESIRSRDPDILCVALGNPKQERFIHANRARLNVPVMIGIGGTLDMLVGSKVRAPLWVQRSGLEWLVRLGQEPRRLLGRYALDAWVFPRSIAHQARLSCKAGLLSSMAIDSGPDEIVLVRSGLGSTIVLNDYAAAIDQLEAGARLRLAVDGCTRLDVPSLVMMVGLLRHAVLFGAPVSSWPIGAALRRQCEDLRVDAFLPRVAGPE